MTRKMLALWVALCLLGLPMLGLAQEFYLEELGAHIMVPEGFVAQDASSEGVYTLVIVNPQDPTLAYGYSLFYHEPYADKYLEDLTEEEGNSLLTQFSQTMNNPAFGTITLPDGTLVLLAANEEQTQLHYVMLLGGWVCSVVSTRLDGQPLEEAQLQAAALMLDSIRFDGDDAVAQ